MIKRWINVPIFFQIPQTETQLSLLYGYFTGMHMDVGPSYLVFQYGQLYLVYEWQYFDPFGSGVAVVRQQRGKAVYIHESPCYRAGDKLAGNKLSSGDGVDVLSMMALPSVIHTENGWLIWNVQGGKNLLVHGQGRQAFYTTLRQNDGRVTFFGR